MAGKNPIVTETFTLAVIPDIINQLRALSYLAGTKGQYTKQARLLIMEGIERRIANMTDRERRDYDEILGNIQTITTMRGELKGAPGKKGFDWGEQKPPA